MKRAITRPPARLRRRSSAWSRIAVGVGGYILSNQRLRFPLIEEQAVHRSGSRSQNARGVTPGQGQTVRVAGMRVGDVGEVKLPSSVALPQARL